MRFFLPILACWLAAIPMGQVAQAGDNLDSMRRWQQRVQRASIVGQQSVVGIGSLRREPIGSGVIVSADGLVLTAAHVTAELAPKPGDPLVVYLPSGKRLSARALGREMARDAAMIKIDVPAGMKLPYARLLQDGTPKEGDWTITIGHTSGFQPDRAAPVRVGRVLQNEHAKTAGGFLYTDGTLAGGDSGGGLFNLDGRLVGIHSQIGTTLLENMHIPLEAFRAHWASLRVGNITEEVRPLIHIAPRGAETDFAEIDPMLEEIMRLFPDGKAPRFMMLPVRPGAPPPREAKEFGGLLAVVKPVAAKAARATVTFYQHDNANKPIALGTTVTEDGLVLTKASEVMGRKLNARLGSGRIVKGKVVGVLASTDLALVRLDANRLPFVRFSEFDAPLGSFFCAPAADGSILSIGVKAVKSRRIDARQAGYLGVMIKDEAAGGVRITQVLPGSPAESAGLKENDVIRRVDRLIIGDTDDLMRAIGDVRPGFSVDLRYIRGGKYLLEKVRLANRADADVDELVMNISEFMGGDLSAHRSHYPAVIQHDLTLKPNQCGGPLVDLEGRVVGINIARAGRTKTYAVPGSVVADLLNNKSIWSKPEE